MDCSKDCCDQRTCSLRQCVAAPLLPEEASHSLWCAVMSCTAVKAEVTVWIYVTVPRKRDHFRKKMKNELFIPLCRAEVTVWIYVTVPKKRDHFRKKIKMSYSYHCVEHFLWSTLIPSL